MRLLGKLTATIGMMVAVTLGLTLAKLMHFADVASWSWWAVAAPMWAPWAVASAAGVVLVLAMATDRAMRRLERWAHRLNA